MNEAMKKVQSHHLDRDAYLYVRQSTIRQVFENRESTKRQYALKQRAIALGWPTERIMVIDSDLGQSGASAHTRAGFKQLVSEVGLGHAGIVLGLEVSRLARNSSDWHRLLEICALSQTLILDEDGVYDPAHFNDRLLLGLKGTMSEAELHMIRARMHGAILAKAKRGEMKAKLPIGFVHGQNDRVVLDPDKQVRQSVITFFTTFRRIGTAYGTVKYFKEQGLKFPRRISAGPNKGELVWGDLVHSRAIQIIRNPRYAGAFFWGRIQRKKLPEGTCIYKTLPRDQWHALVKDVHERYISWEEHEANMRRIAKNSLSYNRDTKKTPPREGAALLQGILLCGNCGKRLKVNYYQRVNKKVPWYICLDAAQKRCEPICQSIHGGLVDEAIGRLLIDAVGPLSLEVAIHVQDELNARFKEMGLLRKQHVQRARYEVDLARRRYMQVDPENRMVADCLESEWNDRLRDLENAQQEYERQRKKDLNILGEEERKKILSLATDFPKIWHDPKTPCREKKRMVRLLIEDVTVNKLDDRSIVLKVRFRGGATKTLHLPPAVLLWDMNRTGPELISKIDKLLSHFTDEEVAEILNKEGFVTGARMKFQKHTVAFIRKRYGLKSRYTRLKEQGFLTLQEVSYKIKVPESTLRLWIKKGFINKHRYNSKNSCLYDLDEKSLFDCLQTTKHQGMRRKKFIKLYKSISEVHYDI